ncbi:hypothetical protein N752_20115 [Desulforamulus aquiferis]|nr:hypothetical protein [Desulforamulus aquiferis]RYD03363.1 hypothetical protein N752_20115 [Desulforamulus aquiferis]
MKNLKSKAVSTALVLALVVPTASFAANSVINTEATAKKEISFQAFKEKRDVKTNYIELVEKYSPESLEEWKSTLAESEELMAQLKDKMPLNKQRVELSEEAKEKMQTIREGIKAGTLTPEQAAEELKALGIEKLRGDKQELSVEAKEKMQAMFQGKNGEGLKAFDMKKGDKPELPDEMKEKMQTLREGMKNIPGGRPELSDEMKEKCKPFTRK